MPYTASILSVRPHIKFNDNFAIKAMSKILLFGFV